MNETLQSWVDSRIGTPGMLGGGIRLPDGSTVCRSGDETFPPGRIGQMLDQLAQFQPQLSAAIPGPLASTWRFEQGLIRCVLRPDGSLLALAARHETEAAAKLDQIGSSFLTLE